MAFHKQFDILVVLVYSKKKVGDKMSIGENIRLHRKEKGLTQEELGELVGISGVAVMRYEKGPVSYTHLTLPTICSV